MGSWGVVGAPRSPFLRGEAPPMAFLAGARWNLGGLGARVVRGEGELVHAPGGGCRPPAWPAPAGRRSCCSLPFVGRGEAEEAASVRGKRRREEMEKKRKKEKKGGFCENSLD